jgi:hypothetical protein
MTRWIQRAGRLSPGATMRQGPCLSSSGLPSRWSAEDDLAVGEIGIKLRKGKHNFVTIGSFDQQGLRHLRALHFSGLYASQLKNFRQRNSVELRRRVMVLGVEREMRQGSNLRRWERRRS